MIQTEIFDVCQKKDVVFLQIPAFKATGLVHHGFSTRIGGVSTGIFESMNLGLHRGDVMEHVRENFRRFCEALEINTESMVFTNQVHETVIRVVTEEDRGKGFSKPTDIIGVDGLITNCKQVALTTFYADCVPLYFLDPAKKAVGLSHSGWRGTVKQIGPLTVQRMGEVFGSKPEDILVAIGPSIGPCCYEVSEDVKIEVEKLINHDIIEKIVRNGSEGKYFLDLWALNEHLLLKAGILPEHLVKTDVCTMCQHEVLFSHRATEGKRGSLVAMMELKA